MADDVREARATEFIEEGGASGAGDGGRDRPAATATAAAPVAVATRPATDISTKEVEPDDPAEPSPNGAHGPGPVEVDPALGPAIVAVVAGEGLEKLFRDFGVQQ